MDKNSMLYWWDLVKDLSIPKPKTIVIKLREEDVDMFLYCYFEEVSGKKSKSYERFRGRLKEIFGELKKAVEVLGGYPVFLRTDYTSGKHYSYRDPIYRINNEKDLSKVWVLICECHEPLDVHFLLPPKPHALVLREWLNIEKWTNIIDRYNTVEARLFIKGGKAVEAYPYYHWSGLEERISKRLGEKIKELRRDYERYVSIIKEDLDVLLKYAGVIAEKVEGYWSVDFVRTDRGWYFIDMALGALGEYSWKPKGEVGLLGE